MKEYKVGDVLTRKNGKVYDVVASDGICNSLDKLKLCSFLEKKACHKVSCGSATSGETTVVFIKRKKVKQ